MFLFEAIIRYYQHPIKTKKTLIETLMKRDFDFDFTYCKILDRSCYNMKHIFELIINCNNPKIIRLFMEKYFKTHKTLNENYIGVINNYLYTIVASKTGAMVRTKPGHIDYDLVYNILKIIQNYTYTNIFKIIKFDNYCNKIKKLIYRIRKMKIKIKQIKSPIIITCTFYRIKDISDTKINI